MKKGELRQLYNVMEEISNLKGSAKFAYCIAINKSKLRDEMIAINEAEKILADYEKDRLELCKELAKKDEAGEPIVENGEFVGVVDNPAWLSRIKELGEKHKTAIDSFNEILNEDVVVDLRKINFESFPDEVTPAQMLVLLPIIEEENAVNNNVNQ